MKKAIYLVLCVAFEALLVPTTVHASSCEKAVLIFFAHGSAVPKESDIQDMLRKIELYQLNDDIWLYIATGHADKTEKARHNTELLGMARAAAIIAPLLRALPQLKSIAHIESKGATQPDFEEASKNRRTVLYMGCVVKPENYLMPPMPPQTNNPKP